MTSQIPDQFFYKDQKLTLDSIIGNSLYTPLDFKIETLPCSTGCGRGYIMKYVISDSQLILDGFLFRPKDDELPEINGIKSFKLSRESGLLGIGFKNEYKNLNKKIPFNGSICVKIYLTDSQFIQMGLMEANSHRTVIKFDFEDGIIMNLEDISKGVENARKKGDPKGYRPDSISPEDLHDWIMKRLALDVTPRDPPKQTKSVLEEMQDELERLKKLQNGEE